MFKHLEERPHALVIEKVGLRKDVRSALDEYVRLIALLQALAAQQHRVSQVLIIERFLRTHSNQQLVTNLSQRPAPEIIDQIARGRIQFILVEFDINANHAILHSARAGDRNNQDPRIGQLYEFNVMQDIL